MESENSECLLPESAPARQSSVTLSHQESEEEMDEDDDEEMDEDDDEENNGEDESLTEDAIDGASFSIDRQRTGGSCSSSSRGSFEEMRSSSSNESLEQTSTVSEDIEELESSLDSSLGSSCKPRSLDVHKPRMHYDEGFSITNLEKY